MSLPKNSHNLAQLLAQVLTTFSKSPAIRYSEGDLTFGELGDWIDSLASLLILKGLKRGDVIGIANTKHPLSFALMLAAIRIGVVYVNIDVASPPERTSRILGVCEPMFLFYDDSVYELDMMKLAENSACQAIFLHESLLHLVSEEDRQLQREYSGLVDGETIAYIMFTSGSTGIPKGVAVTHQNLIHFISWGRDRFGITEKDNFANLSPMYFDNSVFDLFVALFSGASISPIKRDLLTRPYDLVKYVEERGCTVWFSVPSALMYLMTMKAFAPGVLPALRTIIFGGEGYPKVELKKLYDRFSQHAMLVNVYGPTECTCICSSHTLGVQDFQDLDGLPTLGRLNPNFDYRILDENDQDASEGELCLIGPNVAAGYFRDLARTNTSFHTLTDANRFMKRMYRTGDIVKETDGMLNFIGRKDNQIKHMGHRVELEEIENALVSLNQVDQAAVLYHRGQAAFGKLVAFVACNSEADAKTLLQALGNLVPEYMIPAKLLVMQELPKNANGKVDRQLLLESSDYN